MSLDRMAVLKNSKGFGENQGAVKDSLSFQLGNYLVVIFVVSSTQKSACHMVSAEYMFAR